MQDDQGLVRKILSSGRSGVELAALDVAIKLGLAHGGWTPRGMCNEKGPLPDYLDIIEVTEDGFEKAMEQNIANSDGTLLISRGEKTPETRYCVKCALKYRRQFLHADLSQYSAFEAASLISSWVSLQQIKDVFVTGPAASRDEKIYGQVKKILEAAFYIGFVKTGLLPTGSTPPSADTISNGNDLPCSVKEAVGRLKQALPLKDRTLMANMHSSELEHLRSGLGEYIKQKFGLYTGNQALIDACMLSGTLDQHLPDEACAVILRALWEDLQSTHKLRAVK